MRHPQLVEVLAFLERRRQLGQDLLDEVWDGVYYVIPVPPGRHADVASQVAVLLGPPARAAGLVPVGIFNLGGPGDYRVPDGGLLRPGRDELYLPTALVVEIVSPGDKSWEKLGFYAAHHVDELLTVDPQEREVHWLALQADRQHQPVELSGLVAPGPAELAGRIDWPR